MAFVWSNKQNVYTLLSSQTVIGIQFVCSSWFLAWRFVVKKRGEMKFVQIFQEGGCRSRLFKEKKQWMVKRRIFQHYANTKFQSPT